MCIPAGDLQHTLYLNSPEDVVELSEKADLATDDMMDPTAVATSVYLPKVCARPGSLIFATALSASADACLPFLEIVFRLASLPEGCR